MARQERKDREIAERRGKKARGEIITKGRG